jgi:hypothetical protein
VIAVGEPKQLVSELLRPQQLGDLTLPQPIIDRLQRMIDSNSIMNMLFYGDAGLGKTSAARILGNSLNYSGSLLSLPKLAIIRQSPRGGPFHNRRGSVPLNNLGDRLLAKLFELNCDDPSQSRLPMLAHVSVSSVARYS